MRVFKESSIRLGWFAHSFKPPSLAGVFIAKLSCKLQHELTAVLLVDDDAIELNGDVPAEDDPGCPLKVSSDFAPLKPRFDLLLNATARSPTRKPSPSWTVNWRVGDWSKSLRVFGDRNWIVEPFRYLISEPTPISSLQLDYRLAFGGPNSKLNPIGLGAGGQSKQLPSIEYPDRLIKSPFDEIEPAGVGPIGIDWQARQRFVGTYDDSWQRTRWPWFPQDFDYAFFNSAPRDQQLDRGLRGNEELVFENLHPTHATYRSRLPGVRVRCFVSEKIVELSQLTETDFQEVPVRFDTLQIDMHSETATLLFRGNVSIQSLKMKELQTVYMITESTDQPPLSATECLTKFHCLIHADDDEIAEDPAEIAAEESAKLEFDTKMDALEAEHAKMMIEADQLEAESRNRAIANGVDAAVFDQPKTASLSALKVQLAKSAEDLRPIQPDVARELDSQVADLDELEVVELEMSAGGDALTREEVERMAAAGESFHGRSLVELELYDLKLSGLDFSGADFSECMLDGADLSGSNFTNAIFNETDLTQANFAGACLDHADFTEATLEECIFRRTSLVNTNFSELDMTGLDFSGAHGVGTDFSQTKLAGANFEDSQLVQADFSEAELTATRFDRAVLHASCFEGASAKGVSMNGSDLTGLRAGEKADFTEASFKHCKAEGVIWESSTLDRSDLSESNLRRSIFTGASLAGCRFDRADLSDSVFDDADLKGASLDQCNLLRCSLERANLQNARMRNANIFRAGFWDAKLKGLDRRGTSVIGTVLIDE